MDEKKEEKEERGDKRWTKERKIDQLNNADEKRNRQEQGTGRGEILKRKEE